MRGSSSGDWASAAGSSQNGTSTQKWSAAGGVLEAGLAAEARHDLFHDAQPEPGAAFLAPISDLRLGESFEDPRPEMIGDAWAMVAYRDAAHATAGLDADHHLPARRGELDRVGDESTNQMSLARIVRGCRRAAIRGRTVGGVLSSRDGTASISIRASLSQDAIRHETTVNKRRI